MRAALFAPAAYDEHDKIGHLAESAIFSQWQHAQGFRNLRYARWRNEGEVDIVYLSEAGQRPHWIGEIKWSDRISFKKYYELKSIRALLSLHPSIVSGFLTTKTVSDVIKIDGRTINILPSSLYCYTIGRNVTARLDAVDVGAP